MPENALQTSLTSQPWLVRQTRTSHDVFPVATDKGTKVQRSVKHLKQVKKTPLICQQIHSLHKASQIMIRVHWVEGHGQNIMRQLADHLPPPESSPIPLPCDRAPVF